MMRSLFLLVGMCLLLAACQTYQIPVDSFKHQMKGINNASMQEVKVSGPGDISYTYQANPIDTIYALDKNGDTVAIPNSPSLETRFYHGHKGQKTILYFDRLRIVNNNTVYGFRSRFIQAMTATIPLDSIQKIEIQDGGKKYEYIED